MYHVSKGGSKTHHSSIYVLQNNGFSFYSLILTRTPAHFTIRGESFMVEPYSLAIIDKQTPYSYYNPEGDYSDDWLHFNCQDVSWITQNKQFFNKFFYVSNRQTIQQYIEMILWELRNEPTVPYSENTGLLLKALLNHFSTVPEKSVHPHEKNPYFYDLKKLRIQIENRPEKLYSPMKIADSLNMSLSHFQHLYKKFFGNSLKTDVIYFRIRKSMRLIVTSDLSISEIAHLCGYSNDVHFYRQFKLINQCSPREFEQNNQEQQVIWKKR
ncbi:helix-turn-helix domain-containing protein [Enterococcus casseliflavus]|uniref:helix-turn-helix domain-containing protein n=1 Tax=Enterococcus casseliflavus TaxID=37734 RepID=UPI0012E18878|nr:AraC family transcriptional regulator [Enterococcus casseliflavus]MUN72858.1 helix-turn-helix domain-containing protein [Enterococcus casseliflavus]MUN95813.1 helix-turn-helix domain-containing protein [Enterococcus casseliflavus]